MPASSPGKIGFLAADGGLPLVLASNAIRAGHEVFAYVFTRQSQRAFLEILPGDHVRKIPFALLHDTFRIFHADGVRRMCFAGNLSRGVLLRAPVMDAEARRLWKSLAGRSVRQIMEVFIAAFEKEGLAIVPQSVFAEGLFLQAGLYSRREPSEQEKKDAAAGLRLARHAATLDIGQAVVVSDGLVVAVEGIEGTDRLIRRCRPWVKHSGGVLVKTRRPGHDLRYDVPVVGPGTLAAMKYAGLRALALEAGSTMALDLERMKELCRRYDLSFMVIE